jgi:phosphoribosylformylglycinamidine synthase
MKSGVITFPGSSCDRDSDQIRFRYCDSEENVVPEANPNGSMDDLAGISNARQHVVGMMPHPEWAAGRLPGNLDGKTLPEKLIR